MTIDQSEIKYASIIWRQPFLRVDWTRAYPLTSRFHPRRGFICWKWSILFTRLARLRITSRRPAFTSILSCSCSIVLFSCWLVRFARLAKLIQRRGERIAAKGGSSIVCATSSHCCMTIINLSIRLSLHTWKFFNFCTSGELLAWLDRNTCFVSFDNSCEIFDLPSFENWFFKFGGWFFLKFYFYLRRNYDSDNSDNFILESRQ